MVASSACRGCRCHWRPRSGRLHMHYRFVSSCAVSSSLSTTGTGSRPAGPGAPVAASALPCPLLPSKLSLSLISCLVVGGPRSCHGRLPVVSHPRMGPRGGKLILFLIQTPTFAPLMTNVLRWRGCRPSYFISKRSSGVATIVFRCPCCQVGVPARVAPRPILQRVGADDHEKLTELTRGISDAAERGGSVHRPLRTPVTHWDRRGPRGLRAGAWCAGPERASHDDVPRGPRRSQ